MNRATQCYCQDRPFYYGILLQHIQTTCLLLGIKNDFHIAKCFDFDFDVPHSWGVFPEAFDKKKCCIVIY